MFLLVRNFEMVSFDQDIAPHVWYIAPFLKLYLYFAQTLILLCTALRVFSWWVILRWCHFFQVLHHLFGLLHKFWWYEMILYSYCTIVLCIVWTVCGECCVLWGFYLSCMSFFFSLSNLILLSIYIYWLIRWLCLYFHRFAG